MVDSAGRAAARDGQRARILEAAQICFARSGFHGTSMQEICAEAGMSAGNLYRYFRNKDAIIEAIVEAEREDNAVMMAPLETAEDPVALLAELAGVFVDRMDDQGTALCAEVMSESLRNPDLRPVFEKSFEQAREALTRAIERGVALGKVDPDLDPEAATRMIMALADGLIMHRKLAKALPSPVMKAMLERMVVSFLRPLPQR